MAIVRVIPTTAKKVYGSGEVINCPSMVINPLDPDGCPFAAIVIFTNRGKMSMRAELISEALLLTSTINRNHCIGSVSPDVGKTNVPDVTPVMGPCGES